MSGAGFSLLIVALAVIGTAGALVLLYKRDLDRARAAAGRDGLLADTEVGPIEYAEKGFGAPLLFIHGAGGGYDQGLAIAADLIGEGFRVVAPSRFGYLRTPVPQDASPPAQADAHAALLRKLNISTTIVAAVSAGARSAVELALRHPNIVTALILISPAGYSPTSPVTAEPSRGSKLVFWLVNNGADLAWWTAEKIAPSVLIRFVGVRPELVSASAKADRERVMRFVRAIEPLSLRFAGINVDSTSEVRELPLETIAAPTLIISARDDLFNTLPAAAHAASKIPNAELIVYDTGGHLLVGRLPEVRAAVRTFLARAGVVSRP